MARDNVWKSYTKVKYRIYYPAIGNKCLQSDKNLKKSYLALIKFLVENLTKYRTRTMANRGFYYFKSLFCDETLA